MRRSPPLSIFTRSRNFLLLTCGGNNSRLRRLLYLRRPRKDHRASVYVYCWYYETTPNIFRDLWLLAMVIAEIHKIRIPSNVFRWPNIRSGLHIYFTACAKQIIRVAFSPIESKYVLRNYPCIIFCDVLHIRNYANELILNNAFLFFEMGYSYEIRIPGLSNILLFLDWVGGGVYKVCVRLATLALCASL